MGAACEDMNNAEATSANMVVDDRICMVNVYIVKTDGRREVQVGAKYKDGKRKKDNKCQVTCHIYISIIRDMYP